MNSLDQLVYCSRARLGDAQAVEQIADIVHVSTVRNARVGITGALTLRGDVFVQLLEGSPTELDILMLHLHFDARHEDIVVLARERIAQRAFPAWGMTAPRPDHLATGDLDRLIAQRSTDIGSWREALSAAHAA